MSKAPASLISSVATALGAGVPPARIQLLAMGDNPTRNGDPERVVVKDAAHARAIATASMKRAGGAPIVIDYDHQTVSAFKAGGRAEAAGWMNRITGDDSGVWAEVEWTAAASEKIAAGHYRYISPFYSHRRDGTVTGVINAGLTNTPNLDLQALASVAAVFGITETTKEEDDMSLKSIASALGLKEDADEKAILDAIAKQKGGGSASIATALGLPEDADEAMLVSTASALAESAKAGKPDPAKFVPVETVAGMQASIASMQKRLDGDADKRRAATIDQAIASGKLAPALKAHAESLDETALASFLAVMPEGLGGVVVKKPGGEPKGDTLTDDEKSIASMMGLSADDYLKTRKLEEAV